MLTTTWVLDLAISKTQSSSICRIFFFNDTATTEIYTLSLHDALPISNNSERWSLPSLVTPIQGLPLAWSFTASCRNSQLVDRKSTRLNSSHDQISYAVFCLKKKKRP